MTFGLWLMLAYASVWLMFYIDDRGAWLSHVSLSPNMPILDVYTQAKARV